MKAVVSLFTSHSCRTVCSHNYTFLSVTSVLRPVFQGFDLNAYRSCGLENILVLRPKGLKDHCYISKYYKTVFITIMMMINRSRLKSFQKIHDDQNKVIVLISSTCETLLGI